MDTKDRLEQELRFLKESLEADVITKEEFLKGKDRIENKLRELESQEPKKAEEDSYITIKEIKDEPEEMQEDAPIEETPVEVYEESEEKIEDKEPESPLEEEKTAEEPEKPTKKPRYKYIAMLLIGLIIIALILMSSFKEKELPVCTSDSACNQESMIGTCINPGTKESKCEFIQDVKAEFIILNDENCLSCDTARMVDVINQLFPSAKYRSIGYKEDEGMKLLQRLDIEVLPAYIFDENISKAYNFNKTERIFIKNKDRYIISPEAAGSNYFFKRDEIKSSLKLFILPNSNASLKAEKNVKEVLNLFKEKITFSKYEVAENDMLSKELAITSYPAFLVNNQLKLTGVQPAEVIKQKFCELNKFEECNKKLSEDIIS